MKGIVVIMALVFCFTVTAQAGWLDKIKEATPEAAKQNIQEKTKEAVPEPVRQEEAKPALPSVSPAASGLSPDQEDANACSRYVHEDWKKSEKALKETSLTSGSSRYLPKKEWIDYLKDRYPNMKREKNDFYVHFGKWFGKSCAYVDLKCVPKEPGCNASMKCLDFYTRKGGQTCPPNLCSQDDKKCIDPYKPPVK